MREITDPADVLTILVVEAEKDLGDKYKKVLEIVKRFRSISSGVHYIKKDKIKWEEVNTLWESLKTSDMTKKEKFERIATFTEISIHSVQRIVKDIENGVPKTKRRINEKSLFEYYHED